MAEKKLTLTKAKAYRADPDAVDIAAFTAIADDALDLLAALKGDHDGGVLRLHGLRTITPEQIHRLKSTELALEFGGVEEISVELAHSLRELDKAALRFPGVSSADETVLSLLAEYHGPELQVGLTSLTDSEASVLAQSRATVLSLPSLVTLDVGAAAALAAHEKAISLPALSRLTAAAATCLAAHEGPLRDIDLIQLADSDYKAFAALRRHPSLVAHVLDDARLLDILRSKDIDLMDKEGWGFPFADRVSRRYFERGFGYEGIPIDDGIAFVMQAEGQPLWRVELPDPTETRPTAGAGQHVLYFFGEREDVLRRLAEVPNRMLTKELATQWVEDPSADLSVYGELAVGAAEILLASQEDICLDGLMTLSGTTAAALAKHQGYLSLDGLPMLTDTAAEALAQHRGHLRLNGLSTLSDSAAEALAEHHGELSLYGLTTLSDTVAKALAKHRGALNLSGVTALSDVAIEAFAKHQGELNLNRVTALSDTSIGALAKHQGGLGLWGLTTLSDAAAEALAKHQGELKLNGLTTLSDAVADKLAKHQGALALNGLKRLSDSAAEAFGEHQGELFLNGLPKLSDAAVEALSMHEAEISLLGIAMASDKAAEALAQHQGKRVLYGLRFLSRAAQDCLRSNQNISLPESIGRYTIIKTGDKETKVSVACKRCGTEQVVTCVTRDLEKWLQQEGLIQTLMPHLTADEREMLLSGVCGDCFDKEFNT